MKVAMHQPDFLPYSGFFYKILKADEFDFAVFDQFEKNGYQRRVKFNDRWVNVSLVDRSKIHQHTMICEVKARPKETIENVLKCMDLEYRKTPNYEKVRKDLVDFSKLFADTEEMPLSDFNISMVCWVLGYLKVFDPQKFNISSKPTKPKADGIIEIMKIHYRNCDTYLSGTGAKVYTTDEFDKAGIKLEYSKHKAKYADSVVGVLCKEEDPLSVILAE